MSKEQTSTFMQTHITQLKKWFMRQDTDADLLQKIVNAPFYDARLSTLIDLGIVVLLLVDKAAGTVNRVALSETELAEGAVRASALPFHDIKIPLDAKQNIIVKAIAEDQSATTEDWACMFTPVLTAEQARHNQIGASIECSLVWPLKAGDGGALIYSFYQPREFIGKDHLTFAQNYAALVDEQLAARR